jgi:hypothetical protein
LANISLPLLAAVLLTGMVTFVLDCAEAMTPANAAAKAVTVIRFNMKPPSFVPEKSFDPLH